MYPLIEIGSIKIRSFSIVLILAVFVCAVIYIESDKYSLYSSEKIFRSMLYAVFFAMVGGKFLSALTLSMQNEEDFWKSLLHSGFVFYGGLIGGVIGLKIYCFIHKESLLDYTDVFFSLLPMGQAIGRFGCYLNGCCYGKKYEGFFSVIYPVNGVMIKIFPTWFVESFFCFILFLCLQVICKTKKRGVHTAVYLVGYSCFRFMIEYMRGDEVRGVWVNYSTSQIISIIMLIVGFAILRITNEYCLNSLLEDD